MDILVRIETGTANHNSFIINPILLFLLMKLEADMGNIAKMFGLENFIKWKTNHITELEGRR